MPASHRETLLSDTVWNTGPPDLPPAWMASKNPLFSVVHGYHCQTFFHFRGKTSVPHGGKMYRNEFPAFLLPLSVPREHPVSVPCRPRSNRKDHSGTSEIHHDVPLPETHNRLLPPETVPSTPPGKNVQPETSE